MRCCSDPVLWLTRRALGVASAAIRAWRLDRVFCRDPLVEVDSQPRQIVRIPHSLADLRRTGEELFELIGKISAFTDPEIVERQIQVQVDRVADRRHVRRAVPCRAHAEELAAVGRFARQVQAACGGDMHSDEINPAMRGTSASDRSGRAAEKGTRSRPSSGAVEKGAGPWSRGWHDARRLAGYRRSAEIEAGAAPTPY